MSTAVKFLTQSEAQQPAGKTRGDIVAFLADAESEGIVREALADMVDKPATIQRGGIGKAIEALGEQRSPHILIVDISGVALPISEVHRLAEVCEPGVHVIAFGDRNDIGLYRDLQHAGVADYVVKPLTRELVRRSVESVTSRSTGQISQKLGKVVTLMGTRGGIGTTTLAVKLASHLANRQGRRVALVDFDLQTGDCGLMLDLKSGTGLREALENPHRIDERFLERTMASHGSHLFVLSAEEPLRDELRFAPEAAEALVSALQLQFHYIVVDVPRTPSAASRTVVSNASVRVIVADETIRSAREIARIGAILSQGDPTHGNLLVINRSGERQPGFIPHGEFVKTIGMQPVATIPVHAMRRAKAASYDSVATEGGRMAEAVEALAAEVSGRRLKRKWWRRWQ